MKLCNEAFGVTACPSVVRMNTVHHLRSFLLFAQVTQYPTTYAFLSPSSGGSPSRATSERIPLPEGGSLNAKLKDIIHVVKNKAIMLGVAKSWNAGVLHIKSMPVKNPDQHEQVKDLTAKGGSNGQRVSAELITVSDDDMSSHSENHIDRSNEGSQSIHRRDLGKAILEGFVRGVFVGITILDGFRKQALEEWISLLAARFQGQGESKVLAALLLKIKNKGKWSRVEWIEAVDGINLYGQTREHSTWGTCKQSSNPFSCGLWLLFHTLTAAAPDMMAKTTIKGIGAFVKNFFGCKECQQHFANHMRIVSQLPLVTNKDGVLWLWRLHNSVSVRVAHQKGNQDERTLEGVMWPSLSKCPQCKDGGLWDEHGTYVFMRSIYLHPLPTSNPTAAPSVALTPAPSVAPTRMPSMLPTLAPTLVPTHSPSSSPTATPTRRPTHSPSSSPTTTPTNRPTTNPTSTPIMELTLNVGVSNRTDTSPSTSHTNPVENKAENRADLRLKPLVLLPPKMCTCMHGEPASGSACKHSGMFCVSCDKGYAHVVSDTDSNMHSVCRKTDKNPLDFQEPGLELSEKTKRGQAPRVIPVVKNPLRRSHVLHQTLYQKVAAMFETPLYVGTLLTILFLGLCGLLCCLWRSCKEDDEFSSTADFLSLHRSSRWKGYSKVQVVEDEADAEVSISLSHILLDSKCYIRK